MAPVPLCVRFKAADIKIIKRAAAQDDMPISVWIREAALQRLETSNPPPLAYAKASKKSKQDEQKSIRFKPQEYVQVKKTAARDDHPPSAWVRSAAVELAQRRLKRTEVQAAE